MSSTPEELLKMLDEKIKSGESFIDRLLDKQDIDGASKLQRKIRQETEFLKRVCF